MKLIPEISDDLKRQRYHVRSGSYDLTKSFYIIFAQMFKVKPAYTKGEQYLVEKLEKVAKEKIKCIRRYKKDQALLLL